jgi:glycosyltransferase involved in cell wall biosynthesis
LKLVIQIPCLNEAQHIGEAIACLPRGLDGIDTVEILVIDDGSTDGTSEAALRAGADHVVRFAHNRGLSIAFQTGLREALRVGADIIVNTDADNQYDASCIADLVRPLIEGRADIAVGDRRPHENPDFSWSKRRLQRLGSWVVALAGAKGAADAASGFRAYTREAAFDLLVINRYTYTVESTIQAGLGPLNMVWVPVRTNPPTRDSRLARTTFGYVRRNALTVIRVFATYRPLRFFGSIAVVLAVAALMAFVPFLRQWLVAGDRSGNLQSIMLGAILSISSVLMFAIGVLGDLIGVAREVSHRTLVEVRQLQAERIAAESQSFASDASMRLHTTSTAAETGISSLPSITNSGVRGGS